MNSWNDSSEPALEMCTGDWSRAGTPREWYARHVLIREDMVALLLDMDLIRYATLSRSRAGVSTEIPQTCKRQFQSYCNLVDSLPNLLESIVIA